MPKNADKYHCDSCNFKCSKISNYNKHLMTRKHQNRTILNDCSDKKCHSYICANCSKEFSARNTLWYHAKKCQNVEKNNDVDNNIHMNTDYADKTDDIVEILKQNQEFKELLVEQNKLMLEQQSENQKLQSQLIEAVMLNNNNTINNTVNNTTNNNQKFNLNFFLNTTCKDAMNMSEFIENMEVNFKDIENIGKNGYVSGMTDMIVSRIKELDVTKRPMHCTDLKRETMYIKDNNEWTKDTPENTKLHQMIDYMAKQNYAKMPLWRQRNPECLDSDHPKYDFCIKMMRNMLGDVGMEQVRLDNKVIKNLSKHIFVDKAAN